MMQIWLFYITTAFCETVTEYSATKFTIGTPSCSTVPSFEYEMSNECDSETYYENGETCTITCNSAITMTCDCLTSDTVISFLKEDGCSWTASSTCETSVQSTSVSLTLETSATTMTECEDTADTLESSLEIDLASQMGTADSISTLTITCEERSTSIARKRRSTTQYDASVEIEIATIVDNSANLVSVVTDEDTIEDLVADTVTSTVEDDSDLSVVVIPTDGLAVNADMTDTVVVTQETVDEESVSDISVTTTSTTTTSSTTATDDSSTTTTISATTTSTTTTADDVVVTQNEIVVLETKIQELTAELSHVMPKIELLEGLADDSQKMFTSMATLIDELEYEQKEEKIKTMMNMMSGMHTASRLSQVEVNSSSGLCSTICRYVRYTQI